MLLVFAFFRMILCTPTPGKVYFGSFLSILECATAPHNLGAAPTRFVYRCDVILVLELADDLTTVSRL